MSCTGLRGENASGPAATNDELEDPGLEIWRSVADHARLRPRTATLVLGAGAARPGLSAQATRSPLLDTLPFPLAMLEERNTPVNTARLPTHGLIGAGPGLCARREYPTDRI